MWGSQTETYVCEWKTSSNLFAACRTWPDWGFVRVVGGCARTRFMTVRICVLQNEWMEWFISVCIYISDAGNKTKLLWLFYKSNRQTKKMCMRRNQTRWFNWHSCVYISYVLIYLLDDFYDCVCLENYYIIMFVFFRGRRRFSQCKLNGISTGLRQFNSIFRLQM